MGAHQLCAPQPSILPGRADAVRETVGEQGARPVVSAAAVVSADSEPTELRMLQVVRAAAARAQAAQQQVMQLQAHADDKIEQLKRALVVERSMHVRAQAERDALVWSLRELEESRMSELMRVGSKLERVGEQNKVLVQQSQGLRTVLSHQSRQQRVKMREVGTLQSRVAQLEGEKSLLLRRSSRLESQRAALKRQLRALVDPSLAAARSRNEPPRGQLTQIDQAVGRRVISTPQNEAIFEPVTQSPTMHRPQQHGVHPLERCSSRIEAKRHPPPRCAREASDEQVVTQSSHPSDGSELKGNDDETTLSDAAIFKVTLKGLQTVGARQGFVSRGSLARQQQYSDAAVLSEYNDLHWNHEPNVSRTCDRDAENRGNWQTRTQLLEAASRPHQTRSHRAPSVVVCDFGSSSDADHEVGTAHDAESRLPVEPFKMGLHACDESRLISVSDSSNEDLTAAAREAARLVAAGCTAWSAEVDDLRVQLAQLEARLQEQDQQPVQTASTGPSTAPVRHVESGDTAFTCVSAEIEQLQLALSLATKYAQYTPVMQAQSVRISSPCSHGRP